MLICRRAARQLYRPQLRHHPSAALLWPIARPFSFRAATRDAAAAAPSSGSDAPAQNFYDWDSMDFECFQEARNLLRIDRMEKLDQIRRLQDKIRQVEGEDVSAFEGSLENKQETLAKLREKRDTLVIYADANDPEVKRIFEDGQGDMNKPIYRHLAQKKWENFPAKIIAQRISQFSIVPDLLPSLTPTASVDMYYDAPPTPSTPPAPPSADDPDFPTPSELRAAKHVHVTGLVSPGSYVPSLASESGPPKLAVQVFDSAAPRLVTVAIIDADVPDVARDAFVARCHFLAANVPLSAADGALDFEAGEQAGGARRAGDVVVPWLPPHAQKGAPYHRLCVLVLDQGGPGAASVPVDAAELKSFADASALDVAVPQMKLSRAGRRRLEDASTSPSSSTGAKEDEGEGEVESPSPVDPAVQLGFSPRSLLSAFPALRPIGFNLFRVQWDDDTAAVMERAGFGHLAAVGMERKHFASLRPPQRARGWEARRQGPKYKHLWHLTKRIKDWSPGGKKGFVKK